MGFWSSFFGGKSDHEREVEELYVRAYRDGRGMPETEAGSLVRDAIAKVKKEGQKAGTWDQPLDFGDSLIARRLTDETVRVALAAKYKEGVRDEDIRWWWNLHDLDRRMMGHDDDFTKMTSFLHHIEQGLDPPAAAARMRKFYPIYGDPEDTSNTTGDDRPLPYELKDRVNIYIAKRVAGDTDKYKAEMESSSTFNAIIRREIRAGKV